MIHDWSHLPEPDQPLALQVNIGFRKELYPWRVWLNRYAKSRQAFENHIVIEALRCLEAMGGLEWRARMPQEMVKENEQ